MTEIRNDSARIFRPVEFKHPDGHVLGIDEATGTGENPLNETDAKRIRVVFVSRSSVLIVLAVFFRIFFLIKLKSRNIIMKLYFKKLKL